jgi:hypothetical protein
LTVADSKIKNLRAFSLKIKQEKQLNGRVLPLARDLVAFAKTPLRKHLSIFFTLMLKQIQATRAERQERVAMKAGKKEI